jgi:DNA-binding NarL/FixJ family response regulator
VSKETQLTEGQILWRRFGEKCALWKFGTRHRGTQNKEDLLMDLNGMKITPRDQQVLELLVGGCSNKEIAGQLSISPRTVKQHLRTLFLRAGIKDGRKRVKLAIAIFEQDGTKQ